MIKGVIKDVDSHRLSGLIEYEGGTIGFHVRYGGCPARLATRGKKVQFAMGIFAGVFGTEFPCAVDIELDEEAS